MGRNLILLASLTALWQVAYWVLGDHALGSPAETLAYLYRNLQDPDFLRHVIETIKSFVIALLVSTAIGLSAGFAFGIHRLAGNVAEPVLISLYSVPKVTLYPFILMAFGIGLVAKVAFGVIHGIFPIAIFTMNALKGVNPVYLDTARVLKLDRYSTFRRVLFPAAAPEIFTGLRIGFSVTLLGTLLAEMFASRSGLGFLLMNAIGLHHVGRITAVAMLLVVFSVTANGIMLVYERRLYDRAGLRN